MQELTFGWTDYILFGTLLGVSLFIGIYFGFFSKQNSTSEYLFGGKTMAYVPVAMSILSSMLSGITFLGIPTEVYFHGAMYIVSVIPSIISCMITAYVFIPILYDLQLSNSYEYLEQRFSRTIRMLASFMYFISLMLYIPIVIYVPALACSQVTGYNIHMITPIFSIVCITYTTLGGVKAVVWTDTIQFIFTIGGFFTILVVGIKSIGGFSEIWRIADEGGRFGIFDMNPSPFERHTFWTMTVGTLFGQLSRFTIGQKFVQRFLSIEQETDIKKAIFLMMFGWILLHICCVLTGLVVYAKYNDCDPLSAKLIDRNDQILPYYVMDIVGHIPGLPGIFIAGLVSSALSTMSASLNTLSGVLYEDFIQKWIPEGPNKQPRAANIMKLNSVIIGIITIALIFVIEHLGTIFEMATSLSSVVDGALLGLFILAMLVPWVGKKGALTGVCTSTIIMTWISGGSQWNLFNKRIRYANLPTSTDNCPYPLNDTVHGISSTSLPSITSENQPWLIFRISIMYLILTGTVITILVAVITSIVTGETDLSKINPLHVTPMVRRFLPKKAYIEVPLKSITRKNNNKESDLQILK